MFKPHPNEVFKEIIIPEKLRLHYAISNYGRLISYTEKFEDGTLLKGGLSDGYRTLRFKTKVDEKIVSKNYFLYRLVANNFIPKPSEEHTFVLHLDFNRANDTVRNLKWATRQEMLEHSKKSPYVIEAKKKLVEFNKNSNHYKLNSTKVMLLKKRLFDPNRKTRLKMLAKQFGISEMQLSRIKKGENWGHIKID